jgi:hypothetical protein
VHLHAVKCFVSYTVIEVSFFTFRRSLDSSNDLEVCNSSTGENMLESKCVANNKAVFNAIWIWKSYKLIIYVRKKQGRNMRNLAKDDIWSQR